MSKVVGIVLIGGAVVLGIVAWRSISAQQSRIEQEQTSGVFVEDPCAAYRIVGGQALRDCIFRHRQAIAAFEASGGSAARGRT